MSEKLKPCPFCGRGAHVVRKPYETKFCVGCGDDACLGFSGLGWLYDSEKEATEAWNRRAERTCRIVDNEDGCPSCSECGAHYLCMLDASYCPDCGARVEVDE